jgi:hypothetical protein
MPRIQDTKEKMFSVTVTVTRVVFAENINEAKNYLLGKVLAEEIPLDSFAKELQTSVVNIRDGKDF